MKKAPNRNNVIDFHASTGTIYNAAAEQEENIIGQAIAKARKQAGISLAKMSVLLEDYGISVSAAALNKWELGKSVPSAYQLVALTQLLQMDADVSVFMKNGAKPELNEEGMKKVAAYKEDLIASGRYKPYEPCIIQYIEMPVSHLAVSAGVGEFLDEGNFEMVSFPESSVPGGADFGLRVAGDSMEPVYHDGQIVWVQQCERVSPGQVGIFIYNGEGYIKVYDEQEPAADEQEAFTDSYGKVHMQPVMISYNRKYDPKAVSAYAEFKVVGRVL